MHLVVNVRLSIQLDEVETTLRGTGIVRGLLL